MGRLSGDGAARGVSVGARVGLVYVGDKGVVFSVGILVYALNMVPEIYEAHIV